MRVDSTTVTWALITSELPCRDTVPCSIRRAHTSFQAPAPGRASPAAECDR